MILKSLAFWEYVQTCIFQIFDYDIVLTLPDIGLETCHCSNSRLNMNIGGNVKSLTVVSLLKSSASQYIFWDDLRWTFHSWCQNKHISYILKFSKWLLPFWGLSELLAIRCTGNVLLHQDSTSNSLQFEHLIEILAQILTELWHF